MQRPAMTEQWLAFAAILHDIGFGVEITALLRSLPSSARRHTLILMRPGFGLLVGFLWMACASEPSPPDAPLMHSAHDQVTTCDWHWSANGVAPEVCDYACRVPPAEPIVGVHPARCRAADGDRPCYDLPACDHALSQGSAPVACTQTFDAGDGVVGCCQARPNWFDPGGVIPTFFECR